MSTLLHHKLIIEVALRHFSYCVKNEVSGQISHFKSFSIDHLAPLEPQLERIFSTEDILNATYNEILVLHDNGLNTLVPDAIFDETVLGNYLQYTTKVYPTDYFDYDDINSQNCKNVYVPYINYNNFLLDKWGTFTFKHISTVLIEYISHKSEALPFEFWIHLNASEFQVVLLKNKKIIFYNNFQHQTKEDFMYYILFVFEQLKLDTNQVPITLFGEIGVQEDYYEIAYKYIRYVNVLDHQTIAQTLSVDKTYLKPHFIALHA